MKELFKNIICYEVENEDHQLIAEALKVLKDNYDESVRYHTVGAALRCKTGNVYSGINCDGIHGSCAEFIAIGTAISKGEREFDVITATHLKAKNGLVAPCGNCRQMLFEYSPNIKVLLNDEFGNIVKVSVRDLLPFAYEEIMEKHAPMDN